MYKKKNIRKKIFFGAGILTMLLMITPSYFASVQKQIDLNQIDDANISIESSKFIESNNKDNTQNDIEMKIKVSDDRKDNPYMETLMLDDVIYAGPGGVEWGPGLFNTRKICGLEDVLNHTIYVYGDTVHFAVEARCYVTFFDPQPALWILRIVCFILVCEGVDFWASHLILGDGHGDFGISRSYCTYHPEQDVERKIIDCKLYMSPCIEIYFPGTRLMMLRTRLAKYICECNIELNIIHV